MSKPHTKTSFLSLILVSHLYQCIALHKFGSSGIASNYCQHWHDATDSFHFCSAEKCRTTEIFEQKSLQEERSRNCVSPLALARNLPDGVDGTRTKKKKTRPARSKNKKRKKVDWDENKSKKTRHDGGRKGLALPGLKASSSSPPWQVINTKDQWSNAVALRERRETLARGGVDPGIDDSMIADISSSNSLFSIVDRLIFSWKKFNLMSDVGGVAFVGSYLEKRLPPRLGIPEVAFLGRSNVGKSSLLNRLIEYSSQTQDGDVASDRARVGKTPGATASVNLYALIGRKKGLSSTKSSDLDGTLRPILGFADLPGFGYAKLSKATKEKVELAAERYINKRKELALVVLLVDARRVPAADDRTVLDVLYDMKIPICVVATKVDKVRKSQVDEALDTIRQRLDLLPAQPLAVSSVTGEGTKELWRIIMDSCEEHVYELKERAQNNPNAENDGDLDNSERFQWASEEGDSGMYGGPQGIARESNGNELLDE